MLDLPQLLRPLDGDDPCGADLEYDPAFQQLEEAVQGEPERQVGESVIEASEPDWREVRKLALAAWEQTRDLRVGLYLCLAELAQDGVPGFADGLELLAWLVGEQWEGVWPRLDPDDDNDPTERLNVLAGLSPAADAYGDPLKFPRKLERARICASPRLGPLSLRTVELARGESAPVGDESAPDPAVVAAILADAPGEDLDQAQTSVDRCIAALDAIDAALNERLGVGQGADFKRIRTILLHIGKVLGERPATAIADEPGAGDEGAGEGTTSEGDVGSSPGGFRSGQIRDRTQVLECLDLLLTYYDRYEPGSPVPLYLRRARRWATMGFADIFKELAPDAVDQATVVFGKEAFPDDEDDD